MTDSSPARLSRPIRRAVVPAGLLALGLVLAGCSDDGPDADAAWTTSTVTVPPPDTTSADDATAGEDSPAATDVDVDTIDSGKDLAAVMSAAMAEAGSARIALASQQPGSDAPALTGSGAVRYGEDRAVQLGAEAAGQRLRVRLLDDTLYVDTGQGIAGRSWVKIVPGADDALARTFATLVAVLGNTADPKASTAGFDRASSFERLGTKTVNGRKAEGFRVVLDEETLRQVVNQQVPGANGAALKNATSTSTVHLDAEGRPVRVVTEAVLANGTSRQTIDYRGWGRPVSVQAPPADQVVESGQLGGG